MYLGGNRPPVYCVFLCGTNKLEPKKPEALAGCSLCTAALFLVWEPQTNFFTSERRVCVSWDLLMKLAPRRIHIEEKITGHFLTCGIRVAQGTSYCGHCDM